MTADSPVTDDLPVHRSRYVSAHFDGRLVVAAGEIAAGQRPSVSSPLGAGLKIVVKLSGATTLTIDDRPPIVAQAPAVIAILSRGDHRRVQEFDERAPDRYVIIHVDPEVVRAEIGIDVGSWLSGAADAGDAAVVVLTGELDAASRAAAKQIAATVAQTPTQRLYRLGKALELIALTLEQFVPPVHDRRPPGLLTTSELERVHAARDMLFASLRDPPRVDELARRTGLNVRKLNSGFRRAFGGTVQAVLQDQRLQVAYNMIASGELSIAEVAYEVGYTPAHLATAFRKRFGMPPTGLR